MAARTFAELKSLFRSPKIATEQTWTDVLDTIQWLEDRLNQALLAAGPVIVVADQAARLALGPSLFTGTSVKQTDNGVTYAKQQNPGTNPLQWVAIGDVQIEIDDVIGLVDALNARLHKTQDSEAQRLGLRMLFHDVIEDWPQFVGAEAFITIDPLEAALYYAEPNALTLNFNLYPSYPVDLHGRSVGGLLYNPFGTPVEVVLPSEAFTQHSENRFEIPAGKFCLVYFKFIRHPGDATPTLWTFTSLEP